MKRKKTNANLMWGGRFAAGPDALMEAINASIRFDRRLFAQDIAGSKAHAAMLAKRGIYNLELIDSRALVRDQAWEFLFVLGQPLYVGSTQVNINPVAIK